MNLSTNYPLAKSFYFSVVLVQFLENRWRKDLGSWRSHNDTSFWRSVQ